MDAARGQALASRSSCHRVFRSRGPFEPGPGFVRGLVYPDLVAVTFFSRVFRSRGRFVARPGVVRGQVYPDLVAVTFFLRLRLQALPRFSE